MVRPTTADPDADLGSVYTKEERPAAPENSTKIHQSLQHEINEIVKFLKQARSQMLPDFFDPRRINDLFWKMSDGWDALARDHIEQVYLCCERYFREVMPAAFKRELGSGLHGFSNSHKIANRFVGLHVIPKLDGCREKAWEELRRLEEDRRDAVLNADLRILKERRAHRQRRAFDRIMRAHHQLVLEHTHGIR